MMSPIWVMKRLQKKRRREELKAIKQEGELDLTGLPCSFHASTAIARFRAWISPLKRGRGQREKKKGKEGERERRKEREREGERKKGKREGEKERKRGMERKRGGQR
ncbi:RNA-binding protein 25, partial [Ophiophagus hannah]